MKQLLLFILCLMLHALLYGETPRQVKIVIDAIEEQYAVILMEDESRRMLMPLELFPGDAKEGNWYTITIFFEAAVTMERTEHITALIAGLSGN